MMRIEQADPALTIERFGVGMGPNRQGTHVSADGFPSIFVTDGGYVDIGEFCSLPAEDALRWFRAVANHIEARLDAGAGDPTS